MAKVINVTTGDIQDPIKTAINADWILTMQRLQQGGTLLQFAVTDKEGRPISYLVHQDLEGIVGLMKG